MSVDEPLDIGEPVGTDLVSMASVSKALRRPGDGPLVERAEVLRRAGECRHLGAASGKTLAGLVGDEVGRLAQCVGVNHIATLAHAPRLAVALAVCRYRDCPSVSEGALRGFLKIAGVLAGAMGHEYGDGLLAELGDLHVVIPREALDAVEQTVVRDFEARLSRAPTKRQRANARAAATSGVGALRATLHSAMAGSCGLMVEGDIDHGVRVVRSESSLTFPDELVVPLETYARQIEILLHDTTGPGRLAVATALASSCRGGESQPRRDEVRRHHDGSLLLEIPAAIGKTGRAFYTLPTCLVEVVGVLPELYPDVDGDRYRSQGDAATRLLAETVVRANITMQNEGLPMMPSEFGLSYAFRHRNAMVPAAVLDDPPDIAVAVNALLAHSRHDNADGSYDKLTMSSYAGLLERFYAKFDEFTQHRGSAPRVHPLKPAVGLDRAASRSTRISVELWGIMRDEFAAEELEAVLLLVVGPLRTWEACATVEVVEVGGRRGVRLPGHAQFHPLPDAVLGVVDALIARRSVDTRLADPRKLGRLVLSKVERRIAARAADHDMSWHGPVLSVSGLRQLGAEVADSLMLTPAEQRALVGVSTASVPAYVSGSARVGCLLDRAFTPLAEMLRAELSASAMLDVGGRLRW
jgi:hypothetical protein